MKIGTLGLIVHGNNLLLGRKKEAFGQGRYNGCGGKLLEGESPEDGLCREAKDEWDIDLSPDDLSLAARIEFCVQGKPDFDVWVFLANRFGGKPRETASMECPMWYPFGRIPYDKMHPADRKWMPDVLAGKKFRASVDYAQPQGEGFLGIQYLPFDH